MHMAGALVLYSLPLRMATKKSSNCESLDSALFLDPPRMTAASNVSKVVLEDERFIRYRLTAPGTAGGGVSTARQLYSQHTSMGRG